MVRPDVAARKVARAAAWLNDVETFTARPEQTFIEDLRGRDLATFYLFLAIQECLDLGAHWVADEGWGVPDEAGATFDLLADRMAQI